MGQSHSPETGDSASVAVRRFFETWGMVEDGPRRQGIAATFLEDGQYADPRTSGVLSGQHAVATYVAAFSANAPGWTARVLRLDTVGLYHRATIAFGGPGPDGTDMVQHGQYFIRFDGARIAEMVGFAGLGAPE